MSLELNGVCLLDELNKELEIAKAEREALKSEVDKLKENCQKQMSFIEKLKIVH